jgi:transketolase
MMDAERKEDLRDAMVRALIASVEAGGDVLVLCSDSTSTSKIGPFQARFPDRLVNVGIAEQNLLGVAAGLAIGGHTVVTANAACFAVTRSNEQLKNDVCYSRTNVKVAGLNAGFTYGPLASTHHALDDVSAARGLGEILIFAPADGPEAEAVFRWSLAYDGPVYVRMDSQAFPVLHGPDYRFEPGRLDVLRVGSDVSLFAMGSAVWEAVAAAEALGRSGVKAEVVGVPSLRPADRDGILASARRTGLAVTVEEHSVHGGLGSLVAEVLSESGAGIPLRRIGVPEGEFSKAGPRPLLRAHYGIDAAGIAARVREALRGKR